MLLGRLLPLLLGAALVLTGCGQRGQIVTDPAAATVAKQERIIVATDRAWIGPTQFFGSQRATSTNYALFEVSVPPKRKVGTIKYPNPQYPNPQTQFMVSSSERLGSEAEFVAAINDDLQRKKVKAASMFIHGFNTDFAEGLYREAQLIHDVGSITVPVHYSWPSLAKADGYLGDLDNVLYSRPFLQRTIETMARSDADSLYLVAHSMGTFLLVDTLRTMAMTEPDSVFSKIAGVVLISADIDVGIFKEIAPLITGRGVPIFLLISDRDKALAISAKLRGQRDRLGSIRSTAELGNLNRVYVINATDLKGGGALDHFSEAESPALLDYLHRMDAAGIAGLDQLASNSLQGGVELAQAGARLILSPLTGAP
ncbi:alpha/beta hydrolase [Tabrizicola sp. J26]|uniref:alpha/beta hydrolase n=1 Tax=Alitabrizicola rongguiensis TaxID=2909234 RepID=UPI001F355B3A|nr:alpha/beta hydrolase [Tabrizicola rongguiensis]MCF1710836.1 alpha/beta hydrolase [Tabrizicola rongguiensis]